MFKWWCPKMGVPKNGCFIQEKPNNPCFRTPSIRYVRLILRAGGSILFGIRRCPSLTHGARWSESWHSSRDANYCGEGAWGGPKGTQHGGVNKGSPQSWMVFGMENHGKPHENDFKWMILGVRPWIGHLHLNIYQQINCWYWLMQHLKCISEDIDLALMGIYQYIV